MIASSSWRAVLLAGTPLAAAAVYAILRWRAAHTTSAGIAQHPLQDHLLGRARRSRFRGKKEAAWYCTSSRSEYEAAATALVQPEDVVLEVGCQLNATTRAIASRAAAVVGVDIARKPSAKDGADEMMDLSNVSLHVQDVWDLGALQAAIHDAGGRVDLLIIDPTTVLGHDLLFEIVALVRTLQHLVRPRATLVKSKALCALQMALRSSPARRLASQPTGTGGTVQLIGASGVSDYREAAWEAMRNSDAQQEEEEERHLAMRTLEIGAFEGATCALLAARGATACFGVDVSSSIVERGRRRYGDAAFRLDVADAWDGDSLDAAIARSSGWRERFGSVCPELICVDVGGLSGASGVLDALALLRQLAARYRPSLKAIVIKSSCVRSLATSLRGAHELLQTPPAS